MTRSAGWVGVFFLGVAVGLWSHAFFPALQFDTKVSVAAIGNLFVALAIGFLVHHFATLRHAQKRAEKDFVMKKAEQLAAKLEVARGVFDQCLESRPQISNNEVQTLLLALRSVFNAAFEIEQASAICELKDAVARTAQIKAALFRYKNATTVSIPRIEPGAAGEEEQAYRAVSEQILRFIVAVNRG